VLGGVGTVGAVTSSGGTISPGDSPGVLNTGSLTLNSSSTFLAELDGTKPGDGTTGYDQIVASGPVNLGGVTLGATLSATVGGGYAPHGGDQVTIVQNNSGSPITGTFANLPEGSDLNISGSVFQISYLGGPAGDNVVLTALTTATTTTVTSSPNPAVVGQSVTFTARVSSAVGTPTGTVIFLVNGTPIGAIPLVPLDSTTAQATLTTASLGLGASTIMADYISSDPTLQSSQSSALTQNVATGGTRPLVSAVAVRNRRGQLVAVDLDAQVLVVSPGAGVPTGTVTYYFGGRVFQTRSLTNGTAVLRVKPSRALGQFLYIRYNGNADFQPSVSTSSVITSKSLKKSTRSLTTFSARGQGVLESPGHAQRRLGQVAAPRGGGYRPRS
jgi:hypothetical protein